MSDTGLTDRGALRYLVSASEIADLVGATSASIVSNWRARHADFPLPVSGGHNALFDVEDVLAWIRRPDTPARLQKPTPRWWWEKTVDAVRATVDLPPRAGATNPLRSHLAATVLLHAALRGDVPGVHALPARWDAVVGSPDPGAELIEQAGHLEDANGPALGQLLVEPLSAVTIPAPALSAVLSRLDQAAVGGVEPSDRLEVVLDQVSPGGHRRQLVTTTADKLATVVADVARPTAGEVLYDPCVGEGGLLLHCARASGGSVTAFAQELDVEAWRTARTRFLLEPLTVAIGRPGYDSIGEDQFPALRADVVVADPPVAARTSLVGWVEHVLAHLADDGRGVIAIPAYAVTPLTESRRQHDEELVRRLDALARAGHVVSVAVLTSDFRRDVPGPMTVWALAGTADPNRTITVNVVRRERSGAIPQPPRRVTAAELRGVVGSAARALRDTRGRRSDGGSGSITVYAEMAESVGEQVRRKLADIEAKLGELAEHLPSEGSDTLDELRQSLHEVDEDLDRFS